MGIQQEEWFSIFEVRMAERLTGGDPAEFVQCLIDIIDSGTVKALRAALQDRGLTLEDLMELREQVAEAEAEHSEKEFTRAGGGWASTVVSEFDLAPTSKEAVRRLFLARFDEAQIAEMLELEAARVGQYLSGGRFTFGSDAQEIIKRHLAGESSTAIAKRFGTSRQRVDRLVLMFGRRPITERNRVNASQREQILRLRAEGHGYTAIANQVEGVDYNGVRYVCRKAARSVVAV